MLANEVVILAENAMGTGGVHDDFQTNFVISQILGVLYLKQVKPKMADYDRLYNFSCHVSHLPS